MLGKKYEISRNELFDQFECDGKLFESLDDALKYADELETKAVEAEIEAEMQRAERAVQAEKYLSEMTFKDMQKKLGKKYIWVTMPILKNGYKIEEHASGKKQYFETLSQSREYYKSYLGIKLLSSFVIGDSRLTCRSDFRWRHSRSVEGLQLRALIH